MVPRPILDDGDGITVTEIPDIDATPASPGLLGNVLDAYRLQGYDAGYARARHEIPCLVASELDDFLREHPETTPEARRTLLQFESFLLRRAHAQPSHYVEGGLGI